MGQILKVTIIIGHNMLTQCCGDELRKCWKLELVLVGSWILLTSSIEISKSNNLPGDPIIIQVGLIFK
jgi:hypothetical protein